MLDGGSIPPISKSTFQRVFFWGMTRFRQRELAKTATREAMDVIQAKTVNAEKANTLGTVKLSMGKNFRFARGTEAVAA